MAVLSIHCVCPSCYVDIIEPVLKPKVTDLRALQPHSLFKRLQFYLIQPFLQDKKITRGFNNKYLETTRLLTS